MAADTPFLLSKVSQEGLILYHKHCYDMMNRQWDLRGQMRKIDLAYMREQDLTVQQQLSKLANTLGDSNKIQNITVPIIQPQIRASVGYQSAIFLSDYPLFGVTSSPQYIEAAKQMQALIEENSIREGWIREFLLFFYDGFKYNLSAIEVEWKKKITAALESDPTYKRGQEARPVEVIWQGNSVKRWDLYNTYFDHRVLPYEIPDKGEFAGHTEIYSKTALKSLIASLDNPIIANIVPAFESPSTLNVGTNGAGVEGYYIPQINPDVFVDPNRYDGDSWDAWVGLIPQKTNGAGTIQYQSLYEVSTEYVRIMPAEFSIKAPGPNTPQIWKLKIVNHSVIIHAERQTNAHEKIPVFFGCPAEDGLGYQTKSNAQNALPFQQVASGIMNGVIAARRRAVTDRVLYDPSRIAEAQINNPNPSAKIPVRPAAYGKPISDAVYQFPFRDDQSAMGMQEIGQVVGLANTLLGQNAARQGQFIKGNKTDGQWDTTMSNATTSDQLTALLYEAQVFTPLKEVLKLNYMQYQSGTEVYSPSRNETVKIDPVELRKAIINFKITDGLLPSEKVMSEDKQKVAMQVIGSSPALAQGYNVAPLFSYILKQDNVDFSAFEKSQGQIAYENAVNMWNTLAMQYAQKGVPYNQPQPKPLDYGYNPNQPQQTPNQPMGASPQSQMTAAQQETPGA